MSIPIGYAGKISKGGSPTTLTAEPCTAIADDASGRHRYQVTSAARRVLDPATAIVVKENGVTSSAAHIALVDANTAIITFAVGYTPTAPVTVTGKYIPRAAFTFIKEADSNPEVNTQDVTQCNQPGYDQLTQTTFKWSGGFSLYDDFERQGMDAIISNRTPVLLDFDVDGTGAASQRGWALISKASAPQKPKAANESDFTYELYDQSAVATALSGFPVTAAFSAFAA